MSLPDAWLETSSPGKLPTWSVVSGRTFQRRYQVQAGTPLAAVPLTGCTVSAEICDRTGATIIVMTATITDAANGWIKVSLTPTETEGISFPDDHPPKSNKEIIGRSDIVITDSAGARISVGMADVELIRGESA